MSIEQSGTTGGAKPVAQTAAKHGHGKAAAHAQGAGGFAAMLMTLGADELVQREVGAEAGGGKFGLQSGAESLAEQMTGGSGASTEAEGGVDSASASAFAWTGFVPRASLDDASSASGLRGKLASGEDGLQAVSDERGGRKAKAAGLRGAPTDDKPESGDASLHEDLAKSGGDPVSASAAKAALAQKQVALAQRMADRLQAAEVSAQAAREQVLRAGDTNARVALQVMEPAAKGAEQPLTVHVLMGETGLRQTERRAEKVAQRQAGGETGTWAGPANVDGARLDTTVVAAAPTASAQMQVAEQVSYWIGRGVQTAELELAGLGEGPVKVSIALQGQEAHVDFQADQVQTRQLLEDSVSHLRELLHREGFVLSGVSVGNSGSQGAGGKQSQARQGGRQAVVVAAELQAQAGRAGTGQSALSGRSVDLFV